MSDELTEKQKSFIREYVIDFNGAQSAIRAGYSEKTAKVQASQLLSNDLILEGVKEAVKGLDKQANLTKLNLLERLENIIDLTESNKAECHKAIKAIEVYSKMCGMNEPDKVEHSGTTISINYNKPK